MEITTRCCGNCAHAKHLYDNIARCVSIPSARVLIDDPECGSNCTYYQPTSQPKSQTGEEDMALLQKRVRELEVEVAKVPLLKQMITCLEEKIERLQIEATLKIGK